MDLLELLGHLLHRELKLYDDFTTTYEVLNTNYMVWFDYAVIKLSTVFESISTIGLTRKADIFLRLYINTGNLRAAVSPPNNAAPGYTITAANNLFTGTCSLTINYISDTQVGKGGHTLLLRGGRHGFNPRQLRRTKRALFPPLTI
jgi:hypothetical protein